jgi:hypothetical protein
MSYVCFDAVGLGRKLFMVTIADNNDPDSAESVDRYYWHAVF